MPLPKEWPVLDAENMAIGPYCEKPGECGCLAYWRSRVIGISDDGIRKACDATEKAAVAVTGKAFTTTHDGAVSGNRGWTFGVRVTRASAARIWNLAGALLGYVRGNPEAKTAASMKKGKVKK